MGQSWQPVRALPCRFHELSDFCIRENTAWRLLLTKSCYEKVNKMDPFMLQVLISLIGWQTAFAVPGLPLNRFATDGQAFLARSRIGRAVADTPDATDCVSKCLYNLSVGLGNLGQASRMLDLIGLSKGVITNQYSNASYLDAMCNSYVSCRSCVDACPVSKAAMIVMKGLGELEYMCGDSFEAFKRQSPCLAPVIQESAGVCNSSCIQYFPILEQLDAVSEGPSNGPPGPSAEALAKTLLGPICMLAKCETTCIGQQIEVKCGLQGKRLIAGSLVAAVSSFNDLLTLVGAVDVVPLPCVQIGRIGYVFQM